MRQRVRIRLSTTAALTLLAPLAPGVAGTADATAPRSGSTTRLYGVVALAADDVWAVGASRRIDSETVAQHWDGTVWRKVATPHPGHQSVLAAVAAVSSDDIWAVGVTTKGAGGDGNLILHWDGTKWSVVPGPSHQSEFNYGLVGVSAVSADDVWVVGATTTGSFAEHWDGSAWSDSTLTGDSVAGVVATGPSDVWAVGNQWDGKQKETLAEHWDGTSWNPADTENPGKRSNILLGVAAGASNDVWAVGKSESFFHDSRQTPLAEHWDGTTWSTATPYTPKVGGIFFDASVVGPSDAWAVGYKDTTPQTPLIEHWDGTRWRNCAVPTVPGATAPFLDSVSFDSPTDGWAVGSGAKHDHLGGLVLHWDGTKWSVA